MELIQRLTNWIEGIVTGSLSEKSCAFGWLVGWPGADCCRFLVRASDCIVACHVVILMMHLLSFKKVIYVVDNWILTLCCMEWMSFHG